ncbi:MAG: Lin0512 family protein [Rhodospirillales bacterium]
MSLKRMVLQLGQGTDIHGADSTKAAERAVRDALWRNFLQIADALGQPRDNMVIEVTIGAPRPETIDKAAVAAVFPYGQVTVTCEAGGLEIATPDGKDSTLLAHAAVIVRMDVPDDVLGDAQ